MQPVSRHAESPSEPTVLMTPGRARESKARASKVRRRVVAFLAAAISLGILLGAMPSYRAMKTWRARQLLGKAMDHVAKGRWHEACQSLQAANALAPQNSGITRTIVRILTDHGDPQALVFLEFLIRSPDGTPQDRVDLMRLAMRIGRFTAVQEHLLALLGEPQTARRFDVLLVASEWYGRFGDRTRAIGFARQAVTQARDAGQTAEAKLLLARGLLQAQRQTPADADRLLAEAKQNLREIASRDDQAGLDALLLLSEACKSGSSPDETRHLSEHLARHPLASAEHRLLGLTWKLRSAPEQREQILASASSTIGTGNPGSLAAIARWLVQQKEPRRAIALIPMTAARENKDLFLVYVDALAELGRWQDLQILLAGKVPLPIDATTRRLYEFRTALGLGRQNEASDHWAAVRKSLPAADPKTVLYVAQYAERLGMREDATKAYRQLTGINGAERAGYLGLILLTEQSGDTRKLRDQIQEFVGRYPGEFEPQNDLAYLDLLLKENIPSSLDRARQFVKRFPDVLAYRTTLALAFLRNGDAAAARKVYDEITTDWNTARPGWRAVHAAVLHANGEQALARDCASAIDIGRLKTEERELIAGLGRLSAR